MTEARNAEKTARGFTKTTHGFSLVELMMVLACAGVLLAWGLPHYQSLLQRHHRAQARTALLQIAHWMERSASANGTYPLPQTLPTSLLNNPDLPYQFSVVSTTYSYSLMATPTGPQMQDLCGTLALHHTGVREVKQASSSVQACWQR